MKQVKNVLTLVVLLIALSARADGERVNLLFNFDWKFKLGEVQNAESPAFDDADWCNRPAVEGARTHGCSSHVGRWGTPSECFPLLPQPPAGRTDLRLLNGNAFSVITDK